MICNCSTYLYSLNFIIIIKLWIIPVFVFCFWKFFICMCQTREIIIVLVKEAGTSFLLAYVGHQRYVYSTNGRLGVSYLPTDLAHAAILIYCFCRLEMYVYLYEITPKTWIGTAAILSFFGFFCKVGLLNLLCWRPPSFTPCSIISILSCGLVLMCSRSHVGVTWIFEMGWVVLDHMIGKYIMKCLEVNNIVVLTCLV